MLLSTNPHPSLSDCCKPAQAIVKKYPFLGDASDDGKEHNTYWQSIVVNDTVAFTRNMKKLAAEMSKTKPSPANLEDLMKQTFPNRRTEWGVKLIKSV